MSAKKWPPPGFPIVEGRHAITDTWSIELPERFARRVEDDSVVLWRPGLTIWLAAWGKDKTESQAERLTSIKESAAPMRFEECENNSDGITRFSYRLRDENEEGTVESIYAYVINDNGHLQMAVYFDDPAEGVKARMLAESVSERDRRRTNHSS